MQVQLLTLILASSLLSAVAQSKNFTLLYTNDLHAHFEPHQVNWVSNSRLVGGFANIATLVKKEKASNRHTLYVDAGDFFTGPYISTLTKGEAVIDVLNHMPLDIATVGNHEFDHGWKNMQTQFKKATFPIVNGNIFVKKTGGLVWDNPYRILTINGIRIGVIGLHGKFAFYDTISDEMIQGVECMDEEEYLKKYIAALKDSTDLILLLVHQGVPGRQSSSGTTDVARNLQKDIELAQRVPGIDIMVTGHAHQGTKEPLISNGTLIVSTDALGIELGKIELSYDPATDKIVSYKNHLDYIYDDEVPDDSLTLATINKWKKQLTAIAEEPLCTIPAPLTRSYGEESPMGNMVSDAMLEAYREAVMAVTNSGALRQDIPAGVVTIGSIISAFPFPNTVFICELSGEAIRKLLEHGAGLTNGILQLSKGMQMIYDESRPVGQRVISCTLNGKPLQKDQLYKVATSNFVADGGDGFLEFKKASYRYNTGKEIFQVMADYLKKRGSYQPQVEGRIIVRGK